MPPLEDLLLKDSLVKKSSVVGEVVLVDLLLKDSLVKNPSVVGELALVDLLLKDSLVMKPELVLVDLLPKDLLLEDLPKSWLLEDLLQLVFVDLTPLGESDPFEDLDDLLLLNTSVVGESVIG